MHVWCSQIHPPLAPRLFHEPLRLTKHSTSLVLPLLSEGGPIQSFESLLLEMDLTQSYDDMTLGYPYGWVSMKVINQWWSSRRGMLMGISGV